jgi:hypothetical protein
MARISVTTTPIQIDKALHGAFKHFFTHKGLPIKVAVEELMKCALSGSISGSFMEPFLVRKEKS